MILLKRTPIKARRKPRRGRVIDKEFLAWIRTLPCVCCYVFLREWNLEMWFAKRHGAHAYSEAAHVGARGMAQKCSDREAAPMCGHHHRTGKHSHHVLGKNFWSHWGIDRDQLISELQQRFEQERCKGTAV